MRDVRKIITDYQELEDDDFEDTTREERHWMAVAYDLARYLETKTHYMVPETS